MGRRIIAVANQKGGVGKTTTVAALGEVFAKKGLRVLMVDMDPQGNLTESFGLDVDGAETLYEVMSKNHPDVGIEDAAILLGGADKRPGRLCLLPADLGLARIESELPPQVSAYRLREVFDQGWRLAFDVVLIDTPPALGFYTMNALTAADGVLVATTAGKFAAKGLMMLLDTIDDIVVRYTNPSLSVAGVLITRYDHRPVNNRAMAEAIGRVAESRGVRLFDTRIRATIKVEEAQAGACGLLEYNAGATAADDYERLAEEIYMKVL